MEMEIGNGNGNGFRIGKILYLVPTRISLWMRRTPFWWTRVWACPMMRMTSSHGPSLYSSNQQEIIKNRVAKHRPNCQFAIK